MRDLAIMQGRRWVAGAFALAVTASVGVSAQQASAPGESSAEETRVSKIIHNLEQGKSLGPDDWGWVEAEHSPFDLGELRRRVVEMLNDKDDAGRPKTTPLVRLPLDGREIKYNMWMCKQVLDMGFMGIVFPHIDTKKEALDAVRCMRYPPLRSSQHPEPRGFRGHGGAGAARLWGIDSTEYIDRADLWPLNPAGELFSMMMIESPLAAENMREIAQVPGVSALLLIPNDLAMGMGLVENKSGKNYPEVDAVWEEGLRVCEELGVVCAVVDAVQRDPQQRLAEGFRMAR